MKLQVAGLKPESIVDGPGIRATVYFQGCPHRCPGCHNPDTHDPEGGCSCDLAEVVQWVDSCHGISGVTLSGGEPFAQAEAASKLADQIVGHGYNLILYSGYTYERLQEYSRDNQHIRQLLSSAWLLVDGPYLEKRQDLNLPYRGSSNQRIIDLQATARAGKVVEWTC